MFAVLRKATVELTLKMGRVIMLVLLCESVSSAEVGMCLEWGWKPKLTNM